MHFFTQFLLFAPPPGGGAGGQESSPLTMFLPLIMIVVIFYLMIFRPQRKRQKEREALMGHLEKGDKVILSGGMHGTVSAIEDNTVLVQVAENTKLRFEKSAISTVVPRGK